MPQSKRGALHVKYVINKRDMKKFLFLIGVVSMIASCAPSSYQVCSLKPVNANAGDKLVFENEDIKVGYNFWSKCGNSSFAVFNKTDKPIYVDLGNTHFVLNDIANTYFKNMSFSSGSSVTKGRGSSISYGSGSVNSNINTNSYSTGDASVSVYGNHVYGSSSSSGRKNTRISTSASSWGFTEGSAYSVSESNMATIVEQRVIAIPPKSMKIVTGFMVTNSLYTKGGFARRYKETKQYNRQTSPINIKNVIAYKFDELSADNILFENVLYLNSICNYKEKELRASPRDFYIEYKKGNMPFK